MSPKKGTSSIGNTSEPTIGSFSKQAVSFSGGAITTVLGESLNTSAGSVSKKRVSQARSPGNCRCSRDPARSGQLHRPTGRLQRQHSSWDILFLITDLWYGNKNPLGFQPKHLGEKRDAYGVLVSTVVWRTPFFPQTTLVLIGFQ